MCLAVGRVPVDPVSTRRRRSAANAPLRPANRASGPRTGSQTTIAGRGRSATRSPSSRRRLRVSGWAARRNPDRGRTSSRSSHRRRWCRAIPVVRRTRRPRRRVLPIRSARSRPTRRTTDRSARPAAAAPAGLWRRRWRAAPRVRRQDRRAGRFSPHQLGRSQSRLMWRTVVAAASLSGLRIA